MIKIDYSRWARRIIERCHVTYSCEKWMYKDREIQDIDPYLSRILSVQKDWNWRITPAKLRRLEAEIMLICKEIPG